MLVIFPKDRTTSFLGDVYAPLEDVIVMTQGNTPEEVRKAIHHLPKYEPLLLLGHGSDEGLFSRPNEGAPFNRIIVGHQHAYYLRRRCDIIGIWCNADKFATKECLHGLFTGMFISDMNEADEFGIHTTADELREENGLFAKRLGSLLSMHTPLHLIPDIMREMNLSNSQLTQFNYSNVYYL